MPWIALEANRPLLPGQSEDDLLAQMTERVAQALGKPEPIVMARCSLAASMRFRSTGEACAFFDVRGIGEPTSDQLAALCTSLCELASTHFGVQGERCFVVYTEVPRKLWGLDSKMLG
ncbi:MAG: hypothetical protein H6718_17620 [Polyangiaceae bacterium]|nr:hypothetical protein [Myxococcales bacterium]MCB9587222.1 hypothetical protein [Polyangiaceae bacterium]MCB9609395.1 hypothetical protein [Polyangiaceae bacterium]